MSIWGFILYSHLQPTYRYFGKCLNSKEICDIGIREIFAHSQYILQSGGGGGGVSRIWKG